MSILIKNITVITMNEKMEILEDASISIKERRVEKISGEGLDETKYERVIDGEGKIAIPGLINAHTHIPMSLFRSLGDNVKDRLNRLLIPLENNLLTSDMVYKAAKFTLGEMVGSGTTTFGDMYFFCDELARATEEVGARGVIGQTIIKSQSPDANGVDEGFERYYGFYNKYKGSSLVTPAIAPHAPYSNTDESLKKASEISERLNIPLMFHVSEMAFEDDYYKGYGSSIKYLDSLGILNERVIGAHGVYLGDDDMDILASRGVSIAHCPIGNAKSARPIAKVYEMMNKGVNIALGTDGPMSGNHMDMINLMGVVPIMQKTSTGDRSILPADEILKMATNNGAKALGLWDETGSIEAGKLADIVIIDPNTYNMLPIYDYYSAIVYSMQRNNISKVIVDGKLVFENGKMSNIDERETISDFLNVVKKIEKKSFELLGKA